MDWSSIGNFLGNAAPGVINTGAQLYGQQNAAEALTRGETAGIGTQNAAMGNISSVYKPEQTLGNNAFNTLGQTLGVGGQKADYSNFLNMPGYQFAVDQGTRAAERQAAAMGNAGNSGTSAMIGNQVAGTAMGDYNTYVQQLMGAAGFGDSANKGLAGGFLNTAGNITQLQQNTGMAQAGMYTGMGQTLSGMGGGYGGGYNGPGASGVNNGGTSGIGSLIGKGLNYLFGGSNSGQPNTGNANGLNPNNANTNYSSPIYGDNFGSVDPSTGMTIGAPVDTGGGTSTFFGDGSDPGFP